MRRKRKYTITPQSIATRKAKEREIRDVVNRLRQKYKAHLVDKFMRHNYFVQPDTVTSILMRCDSSPVDPLTASLVYKNAMIETFNL